MIAFEAFDSHSENEIEFEISLEPIRVEYLKKPIGQLTFNNEAPSASPKNGVPSTTIEESDSDDDDSYEVDEKTEEDSEAPNPNGSIKLKEGQVFDNAKLTRAAAMGYAIQKGFRLKKIKNNNCRYTIICKNDACEWRLHVSCLPDSVTYMIKSVHGDHSFCRKVAENKKANVRGRLVLQTSIHSNPTINHNLNGKLWHTARVGSVADFKEALKSIRQDSVDAVNWLMSEPVEKWARHAFDSCIKSDHISNNISECFNGWIKYERDKPILILLELLKRKIIKWNDSITLYAREQLMMNEKEARRLEVIHGRRECYGVDIFWAINPIPDKSRWPEIEDDDGNTNEVENAKEKEKGPNSKGKKKVLPYASNTEYLRENEFPSQGEPFWD
ncbi:hypothetical protein ACOSQ2_022442 [Xanthoceras sorbifolium]